MEAGSSSIPIFMATLTIVEVKDYPRKIFKRYPHVATLEDLVEAFSYVLEGIIYVEDIRECIHSHIEDLGTSEIKGMYMS